MQQLQVIPQYMFCIDILETFVCISLVRILVVVVVVVGGGGGGFVGGGGGGGALWWC